MRQNTDGMCAGTACTRAAHCTCMFDRIGSICLSVEFIYVELQYESCVRIVVDALVTRL
jgi:hypothetical protein